MKHHKHRKYKILSHQGNSTWVSDTINSVDQRCFYLEHAVGDEVYLFEKDFNIFTNRIKFEYSILNLYKIGESYKFKIVKETDKVLIISNYEFLEFAIPISFKEKEKQTTITLEIYDLDLDNNKPKFKNREQEPVAFELDYTDFEQNKVYNLPILETYTNRNDNLFAKVQNKDKFYSISIPPILKNINLGNTIQVILGTYKLNNTPTLKLTRFFIINNLFSTSQQYQFVIEEQIFNQETGITKWVLRDEYGYFHNYYPYNDLTLNSDYNKLNYGDSIILTVIKITDNGFLTLVSELADWSKNNYLIEDVFVEIGYADQEDEYFFKNKEFLLSNDNDVESEAELSYIEQYNEGENLWVFSYLSYLDVEIFTELEKENYERASTLIDIYIKIEKWVLEGSNYLINFSEFKRPEIIKKAESKLEKLEALAVALDKFINGEDQKFIEEIKESLSRIPYLNQTKKNQLKQLVNISQYFSSDTDHLLYEAVILMIKHGFIEDNERWLFVRSIGEKIKRLREKVAEEFQSEENEERSDELRYVISNQFLVTLLNAFPGNEIKACYASVNFMRYLALYKKDLSYLDLAIHMIVTKGYLEPNVFKHVDAFAISLDEFQTMIRYPKTEKSIYGKSGILYYNNKELNILPKNINHYNIDKARNYILNGYSNLNISVLSSYDFKQISLEDNEDDILKNIINILNNKMIVHNDELVIEKGKTYRGKVKAIGEKEEYCFLKLLLDGVQYEPLLHMNTIHKSRGFHRIDMFLKLHDKVQFEITEIKNGKITISPSPLLKKYFDNILDPNTVQIGKVVKVYDNKTFIVTEKGWPVIIFNNEYKVHEVLSMNVVGYRDEYQHFIVDDVIPSTRPFNGNCDELFRNCLIEAGVIYINKNQTDVLLTEEEQDTLDVFSNDDNDLITYDSKLKTLGTLLIQCLEQRLFFFSDTKDIIIHYYLITTIGAIIKSNKSFVYDDKLNKLAEIINLKNIDQSEEFIELETINFNEFDEGNDESGMYLIKYFNTNTIEIPTKGNLDENLIILKKLIETYNLFVKISADINVLKYIKNLIVQQLYVVNIPNWNSSNIELVLKDSYISDDNETKKEVIITNLGTESKNKEFKSSIFYSASEEPQEKVILKTIAGFLNSYYEGGSLFIGVNDAGDIIGIKKDLEFSKNIRTLDQYINHIQSLIVSVFPKEINALIDFKFHKSGLLDYLEIIIPKYERPVSLENEFYQRQGVQTRILKGQDIVDFIFRKKESSNNVEPKLSYDTNNLSTSSTSNYKNVNQNISIPNEVLEFKEKLSAESEILNIDFYKDIKKEGEKQNENQLFKNNETLGILYIYEDNTYMVSLNDDLLDPYVFKIYITKEYKYGSILMCYDNACVNRLEVRSILNKSFNKRYRNAISNYGNLMTVIPSLPKDEVAIEVKKFNKHYLKIYNVSKITEHTIIGLKGNCIVQEDFDQVIKYYHSNRFANEYDNYRRDSRQGYGEIIEPNSNVFKTVL